MTIPLYKVHMPPKEQLMPALEKVLYSGFISEGVQVKQFEEAFKTKFDLPYRPLSVNSGTSALQLAYRCANVKDRIVLTSPMTCFANVSAIVNEGGKIVWCDIDPRTGNISAADVNIKIQRYGYRNVAAVSFVDLAGFPADLDALSDISAIYGIPLIEDAAQSLGAKWNGRYVGSAGIPVATHYVAFSFQAIKHLTTVDGGMLSVNEEYADMNSIPFAKRLKWFGIDREAAKEETRWMYDIYEVGYKFHMNNVNAIIGLEQLNCIDSVVRRHVENGKYFNEALKDVPGVKTPYIPQLAEPSYWIYPLRVEKRDDFAKALKAAGVATNIGHVRNDSYTVCQNFKYVLNHTEELPGLNEYEPEYIFIPCHWDVSVENREYIVETIKKGW